LPTQHYVEKTIFTNYSKILQDYNKKIAF